jgi:2-polyprenyl-3-methyl-5-hydroxy-6-metoxy-1,4-benzoquinol methylase
MLVGVDRVLSVPGEFEIHRCPKCGSGKTFPIVEEDGLAALYEGDYANHVDESADPGLLQKLLNPARKLYRWRIRSCMPLSEVENQTGRLLDVGCGNGWVSEMFAERGWEVVGIEPTTAGCEQTAARGIEIHQGTINTVDLPDESFDTVLFFHVLEHVVDPRTDLRRAIKMLKPGGKLLIGVPNFTCWERDAFGSRWLMLELPRHRTHFTPEGLVKLLESEGLTVDRKTTGTSLMTLMTSIQIKIFGHVRTSGVLTSRIFAALAVPLQPPTALFNRLRGGGEILNIAATKR